VRVEQGFCRDYWGRQRSANFNEKLRVWVGSWGLNWEKPREAILSQRKEVQDYSGKALIQVRGPLTCAWMIIVCFHVILDDCNVHFEFVLDSIEFLEISRNRLAALKVRQAAHASRTISGFPAMHRLSAKCCPPSDGDWLAQLSRMLVFSWCGDTRKWLFWYEIL